jgi:hypothetical protein
MLIGNAGNMTGVTPSASVIPVREGDYFKPEEIVSLEAIREHTKTQDIPTVTDGQLERYRKAACESAELYTGLLLTRNVRQIEIVNPPRRLTHDMRPIIKHRLEFPAAEPVVYLTAPGVKQSLPVRVGERTVKIPAHLFSYRMFDCCRPCPTGEGAMQVLYLAGFTSPEAIPAGIVVGILKYIAWAIENPGDVMRTVENRSSVSDQVMKGTNDGAWASGAIDEWRRYVSEV